MSNDQVREALQMKVQVVHHLIKICIQLYMSKSETVDYLFENAKIEAEFTALVWERLEEGSPEFFKAYHQRLALKAQIKRFNELLEKQVELMRKTERLGPSSFNGSEMHSMHNNNSGNQAQQPGENMHQAVTILPSDGDRDTDMQTPPPAETPELQEEAAASQASRSQRRNQKRSRSSGPRGKCRSPRGIVTTALVKGYLF